MLWASEYYANKYVFGYPNPNKKNDPPTCTIGSYYNSYYYVNGMGSSTDGSLIVPALNFNTDPYAFSINVFKRGTCGGFLAAPTDSGGQPVSAATLNLTPIVVGEIANYGTNVGDILICSQESCGSRLTNSSIGGYGAGVAIDKAGDCWLSTYNHSGAAILVYWKDCNGSGQVATGYRNLSYGGLFTDRDGNIGAIDSLNGTLYVYKGCDPACTLVGGPFSLHGKSLFGNLDETGKRLALGDFENGEVDVYKYHPTKLRFSYSFNKDLYASDDVESGIFAPTNAP